MVVCEVVGVEEVINWNSLIGGRLVMGLFALEVLGV